MVNSALQEFEAEIEKFKRQSWKRIFKDWKTQTVATTLGAVAGFIAGGPTAAIALSTGGATITIMNNIAGKDESILIDNTIQYFSMINETIEMNEFIDELINYRKIVLGIT